jgi:hypothetical protein
MRIQEWPQGAPKEPRPDLDWKADLGWEDDYVSIGVEVFMVETSWFINDDDEEGHANLTVHATEEGARSALWGIADEYGVELDEDATFFETGGRETFYINRYEVIA